MLRALPLCPRRAALCPRGATSGLTSRSRPCPSLGLAATLRSASVVLLLIIIVIIIIVIIIVIFFFLLLLLLLLLIRS